MRKSLYMPGNAGVVAMTAVAGGDLMHTLALRRSAIITKIMCYNNTGANITLQFGTFDRTVAGALFVALLPLLVAVNGFDNEWTEAEIPAVEFVSWPQLTAAGRVGDIRCLASAALPTVQIEVKELGG